MLLAGSRLVAVAQEAQQELEHVDEVQIERERAEHDRLSGDQFIAASHFVEEVRRQLIAQYGEKAEDGPNSVYAGGLWVRTSLDPELALSARDALRDDPLISFTALRGFKPWLAAQADGTALAEKVAAEVFNTAVFIDHEGAMRAVTVLRHSCPDLPIVARGRDISPTQTWLQ